LPPETFDDDVPTVNTNNSVNAIFSISSDKKILKNIILGYKNDEFCTCVATSHMNSWTCTNGLWYIRNYLLILRFGDLREQLFQLAHDSLRHFGADKCYASLQEDYYWPNM
jgi:hypothetical protein